MKERNNNNTCKVNLQWTKRQIKILKMCFHPSTRPLFIESSKGKKATKGEHGQLMFSHQTLTILDCPCMYCLWTQISCWLLLNWPLTWTKEVYIFDLAFQNGLVRNYLKSLAQVMLKILNHVQCVWKMCICLPSSVWPSKHPNLELNVKCIFVEKWIIFPQENNGINPIFEWKVMPISSNLQQNNNIKNKRQKCKYA